jgi:multidrug transporter EmrE-like cation transporter
MGFIVAALLGIVVLHEPITTRKVMGLTLALSALAALVGS